MTTRDIQEILDDIDRLTISDSTWLSDYEDELLLDQNNEHHLEGAVGEHIILMLEALRTNENLDAAIDDVDADHPDFVITILEQAIMWSDLGKLATYKDSPKKAWPNGTPQGTAFGHAEKSAEMFVEAGRAPHEYWTPADEILHWIIKEHMNAHKLEEMDAKGKTTIPEFLKPIVEEMEPGLWPKWEHLQGELSHGDSLSKKNYAWIERGNSTLLRIKQQCDQAGRISDLSL